MKKLYEWIYLESIQFINNKNDLQFNISQRSNDFKEIFNEQKFIFENVYFIEAFLDGVDIEDPTMPYYAIEMSIREVDLKSIETTDWIDKDFIKRIASRIHKESFCYINLIGEIEISIACKKVIETN